MTSPLRVLWLGAALPDWAGSAYGPFVVIACGSWDEASQRLGESAHDALVLHLHASADADALADRATLHRVVRDTALVVLAPDLSAEMSLKLLRLGIQELVSANGAPDADALARAVRFSVERKRTEMAARTAYATDLATGLPNHTQLLEHMSHLLALREREPAPMALLVLRIEGLTTTERTLGAEAANVLRRKAAVRLRAGLRASDVVAAIGADTFAVLLAWIDSPADGQRVASKLALSLQQPFNVTGQGRALAVSVGLSQYPEHGKSADELLRRALGQAGSSSAVGRVGFANFVERGAADAANDEG
jgi:diguanylate cyclase (GGDEF)-like protein